MSVYSGDSKVQLRRSIESLHLESVKADLFLSLDGPVTMDVGEYVSKLEANPNVFVFKFSEREGLTKRLSFMLCRAIENNYEFCFRMDADDECINNRLLVQLDFMRRNPFLDVSAGFSEEVWQDQTFIRSEPESHEMLKSKIKYRNPYQTLHCLYAAQQSRQRRGIQRVF